MEHPIDCCNEETCCDEEAKPIKKPAATEKVFRARCGGIYPLEQIEWLPKEVLEAAAGSGNPTSVIDLKEGQIVLDIGSGGGIDCFLAAQKVGSKGKVIGIDRSSNAIERAIESSKKLGLRNVEFKLGDIKNVPLDDETVDVAISNCVVSMSDIVATREAFRVLRLGGTLFISHPLKDSISDEEYTDAIWKAGFKEVQVLREENAIVAIKPTTNRI